MRRFALSFALAAALVGCAGTPIDWNAARKLKVGMTQQEVTEIMGRPYMVSSRQTGQVWIWSYANGMTGGHGSLSVMFDDEGKATSVPKIPDSF